MNCDYALRLLKYMNCLYQWKTLHVLVVSFFFYRMVENRLDSFFKPEFDIFSTPPFNMSQWLGPQLFTEPYEIGEYSHLYT